jgi:hypothetical protein
MKPEIEELSDRIKELGDKSTQILIFLSFALVVVTTLNANAALGASQKLAMTCTMRWWVAAIVPVILGVLPLKEFGWNKLGWYRVIRGLKVVLLWVAISFISLGVYQFRYAI